MAAVTVEDCLKVIPNRFELAIVASYRAKQLMNGSPALYTSTSRGVEKNTVVALREIGNDLLDVETVEDDIRNNIKNQELFKNFEDQTSYGMKKDSDMEELSADAEIADDVEDDIEEDITADDEDDEYYKNLTDSISDDDIEDDLEEK